MQMLPHMLIFGDPDTVGEKLQELMSTGIDGLTINLPVNGHNTDRIGLLGQVANAAIG
jgi:alkanesulfonate monooxygenase SsuD/methylene tetrahydromethanopterin reductase-like flavin-dependent oxidoreductase (luciferase family)